MATEISHDDTVQMFEIELECLRSIIDVLDGACDVIENLVAEFGTEQCTADGCIYLKARRIVNEVRAEMPVREKPGPGDRFTILDMDNEGSMTVEILDTGIKWYIDSDGDWTEQ